MSPSKGPTGPLHSALKFCVCHRLPEVGGTGPQGSEDYVLATVIAHKSPFHPDTPTATIRPDPPHPREGQKLLLHCEGRGNPA